MTTRLRHAARRLRERLGPRERGMTTLEWAILMPVVILAVFALVQVGVWLHGRDLARTAASIGVQAARVEGGTTSAGTGAARAYMARTAPGVMAQATTSGDRGAVTTTIRVSAPAPRVIPLVPLPDIDVSVQAPTERLTR